MAVKFLVMVAVLAVPVITILLESNPEKFKYEGKSNVTAGDSDDASLSGSFSKINKKVSRKSLFNFWCNPFLKKKKNEGTIGNKKFAASPDKKYKLIKKLKKEVARQRQLIEDLNTKIDEINRKLTECENKTSCQDRVIGGFDTERGNPISSTSHSDIYIQKYENCKSKNDHQLEIIQELNQTLNECKKERTKCENVASSQNNTIINCNRLNNITNQKLIIECKRNQSECENLASSQNNTIIECKKSINIINYTLTECETKLTECKNVTSSQNNTIIELKLKPNQTSIPCQIQTTRPSFEIHFPSYEILSTQLVNISGMYDHLKNEFNNLTESCGKINDSLKATEYYHNICKNSLQITSYKVDRNETYEEIVSNFKLNWTDLANNAITTCNQTCHGYGNATVLTNVLEACITSRNEFFEAREKAYKTVLESYHALRRGDVTQTESWNVTQSCSYQDEGETRDQGIYHVKPKKDSVPTGKSQSEITQTMIFEACNKTLNWYTGILQNIANAHPEILFTNSTTIVIPGR